MTTSVLVEKVKLHPMGKPQIKLTPFPAGAVVSPTAKGPGQDNLWPAVRGVHERASPRDPDERESQRLLMGLMNALISELVLEFNEVPEKYAADPEKPLNDHLRATAESRQEKAHW